MAKQLQIRGGTTAQHSTFTGAVREITVDTDKDVVVVHDGSTAGGFPLAKQTSVDAKVAKVTSTDKAIVRFNGTTGEVQNSGVIIGDDGVLIAPNTIRSDISGYGNTFIASGQGSNLQIQHNLNGYSSLVNSGGGITLNTNNTERIRIGSNGNVGIGTSSPDSRLHISSSGVTTLHLENILSTGDGTHDVSIQGYKPYVGYSNVILDFSSYIFKTSAQERMRIDSSGNLLLTSGTGGLGYGTGAGGTVTQLTSKSTAVTLNKPSGQIIMHNAALAAGASVAFLLYNNLSLNGDVCVIATSNGDYSVFSVVENGQLFIRLTNITSYSLSDTIVIRYALIKGATA